MKKLGLIALLFCSVSVFAQRVELIGNYNRNLFYDFKKDDAHQNASYKAGNGYGFKLCVDELGGNFDFIRLSIGYETYQGTASVSDGGMGGGSSTQIDVTKSVLSIGVYPLNWDIKKLFHISLGAEYARLMSEKYTGSSHNWMLGDPIGTTVNFDKTDAKHSHYNAEYYFGVSGRLAFKIQLADQWTLLPQYAFYWGLKKEFKRTLSNYTKSFRHYLGVGIAYQW